MAGRKRKLPRDFELPPLWEGDSSDFEEFNPSQGVDVLVSVPVPVPVPLPVPVPVPILIVEGNHQLDNEESIESIPVSVPAPPPDQLENEESDESSKRESESSELEDVHEPVLPEEQEPVHEQTEDEEQDEQDQSEVNEIIGDEEDDEQAEDEEQDEQEQSEVNEIIGDEEDEEQAEDEEQDQDDQSSKLLHAFAERWIINETTHKVSKQASNLYWQIAMDCIPSLISAREAEGVTRKVAGFVSQRRMLVKKYSPPITMDIGYLNKSTGQIEVVKDVDTTPVAKYPPSLYRKVYEIARVKVGSIY